MSIPVYFPQLIESSLQLLMTQGNQYPEMFKSTRWTCLGLLYNIAVANCYTKFCDDRKMAAEKGIGGNVDWYALEMDLALAVLGGNDNWSNKCWSACDHVYGIQNIDNLHWVAYEYDFCTQEVRVYDSLSLSFRNRCEVIFQIHAAILPSLYIMGCEKGVEDKFDINKPFKVTFVDVPQQQNGCDCGMYALKFIQSLAMGVDFHGLTPDMFPSFRRRLAVDLIKWKTDNKGNCSFSTINTQ